MIRKIEVIDCDQCGSRLIDDVHPYFYKQKMEHYNIINIGEFHFCGKICYRDYIKERIDENEEIKFPQTIINPY